MNLIQKYNIKETDVLNSFNFVTNADVVYAADVPKEKYYQLFNDDSNQIVYKQNDHILFKSISFTLKENDIVFCNSLFINQLFQHLSTIRHFKNITLITHQADLKIDKRLFKKKPECISNWFAVNVSHKDSRLIPIPLGIANTRNTKNLVYSDFKNQKPRKNIIQNKIYCSFNVNTNYFHRISLIKQINSDKYIKGFFVNLDDYLDYLSSSKYTLCPWGNGIDSHRYWEVIYAGNIPITKTAYLYKSFKSLPGYLVNSYKEIDIKNFFPEDVNYSMLKTSWWFKKMESNFIESDNILIKFKESKKLNDKNIEDYFKDMRSINRKKYVVTILRKIHKYIFKGKLKFYDNT
jgi:hypothetical protein